MSPCARFRSLPIVSLVLSVLLVGGGCGDSKSEGPKLIPVTGTVRLDGKPLSGATLMFNPMAGTGGNGGFAVTDAEGKFSLTDYGSQPGCPVGDYGVTFTKITQPDGSPIPKGAQRGEVGMEEQLPVFYTVFRPDAVLVQAKVVEPSSTFEFVLDSKIKPPPSFYR